MLHVIEQVRKTGHQPGADRLQEGDSETSDGYDAPAVVLTAKSM